MRSEKSNVGRHADRPWRDANAPGYFSGRVKVRPGVAHTLRVTYWGGDTNRTFDLLIDGKKIATETLANRHPGEFFDVDYAIPIALAESEAATVEFRPAAGSMAGGVYGCRVLTASSDRR